VKGVIWDGNGITDIEKRAKVCKHFTHIFYDKFMRCKIVFHTRTQRACT
jgi:hypothetical protein